MHVVTAGRRATHRFPLLVALLLAPFLSVAVPSVQAEMSCSGFLALLGYVQENHLQEYSLVEYQNHYEAGLRLAVEALRDPARSMPQAQWKILTTPHFATAEFSNCVDAQRIAATLSKENGVDISPSLVMALQIKGVVKSMDPHSDYLTPMEWDGVNAVTVSAKLGFRMRQGAAYPEIQHVYRRGPADALLRVGDRILRAERLGKKMVRRDFKNLSAMQVSRFLTGKVGDKVRLTISRDAEVHQVEITMRGESGSRVAAAHLLEGDAGYIKLADFGDGAARDFDEALTQLIVDGAKTLILDLRDNPGGSIKEAVRLLDALLDTGVAVQLRDRQGDIEQERMIHPGMVTDMPLTVLINRFSASAAELVALALRDYQRGVLVGEATFGKGTAQETFPPAILQSEVEPTIDGALVLTKYQYFGPGGQSPQLNRVTPHLNVQDAAFEKTLSERRRQLVKQGILYVETEDEFSNALPAGEKLLPVFNDTNRPTNDLGAILRFLLPHLPVAWHSESDVPLAEAIRLLTVYRDSCRSFHQGQCNVTPLEI